MKIFSVLKHHIAPLKGVMTLGDFRRVRGIAPLTAGKTRIAHSDVYFSDAPGFLHSAAEIFRDQVYLFEAKTSQPHIIDAGANIGLSVLYFKSLYPDSTIIAYEPDPTIFKTLQQNVGRFSGVDLRQAAAWTADTELTFYSEGSLAGSTTVDTEGRQQKLIVRAERLRTEVEKKSVDFLKIDIEGAENELIFDIEDCLDNVDNLFFEYHSTVGSDQRLGDLLNLVKRRGYRYIINGPHGPTLPFVERVSNGFDLQLNVSCFRC